MKRIILILPLLLLFFTTARAEFDDAVGRDVQRPSLIDTTASWYNPARVYYDRLGTYKYTAGDFLNAVDLPTVFGVGFVPTGNEDGICYFSQLFLEWRAYKTYGWAVLLGLDEHDQGYVDFTLPDADINVRKGDIFNMDLTIGPGYRIPLVKDIRSYYEHPYICKLNLGLSAQIGGAWSHLYHVVPATVNGAPFDGYYDLETKNYIHPVMKFSTMLEFFTAEKFSIFFMATYTQHLKTMPWDNPTTHAGTLAFSIGFSGFFN